MNNDTYSAYKKQSLFDKAALHARSKMYKMLDKEFPLEDLSSILDVGVTADKTMTSSNFFENLYPHPDRITAFSDQDASWMTMGDSGIKFIQGNALNMPFKDDSFDLVFSSAVIEHVGSRENQRQFLQECIRVSKKFIFITTPNKYYPIELHTALPLLHWLPPKCYRYILNLIGKQFFAKEDNLNLLSKNDLVKLLYEIKFDRFQIKHIRFLGLKSNILLIARKYD